MRRASATTVVVGGENRVALSSSSATRRTTSLTATAAIATSVSTVPNSMRLYSSTSDWLGRRAATSSAAPRRGGRGAGVGARQHQQVLVVAAHPGGEVVELEEPGEALRVLLGALDAVQLA